MNVLVDTPIWSQAFRRATTPSAHTGALMELVRQGRAELIGPVRQELLSGIRHQQQFQRLKTHLRPFPDLPLESDDFEQAAEHFNTCRSRGVQGSNTDFLICAVALRRGLEIFTTDKDFAQYARYLPLVLHKP